MPESRRSRPASDAAGQPDAVPIDVLLGDLGFGAPAAMKRARAALEAAGLTRPGKTGIALHKRSAAEALLATSFVRVCGRACAMLADARPAPVAARGVDCEVCGGSNNRRAGLAALATLRTNGVARVLIVGGTVQQHREIQQLFATRAVEVQCVDGTRASHSQKEARANMGRAQLLVVWASTPLRHAISNLYTAEPPRGLRTITVARRSIEAVCQEISRSYARPARVRR